MNESKIDAHAVGDGCRSLRASCVWADDYGFLVVGNVLHDVLLE